MNSICPMNFFRTTDTTIWKPGLKAPGSPWRLTFGFGPGGGGAWGVLSYMGHIGMCRCEGYGFQAVYSSIGYINQSVWV